MEVSIGLAVAAGLLSFASPCVLALVPVYLAFLGEAATVPGTAGAQAPRPRLEALLFVGGFTVLFVLLGSSFGLVGQLLFRDQAFRIVAGAVVIVIGVLTTGLFGELAARLRIPTPTTLPPTGRRVRAFALGGLVAVGWTPCIGPVLGAILTMGLSSQDVWVAIVLLLAYSAGLAIPFLAAAVALPRMKPLLDALRRRHTIVQATSGVFIVVIGILIMTNAFARLAGLFTFAL